MAGNDTLLKAFDMFGESMTQLATSMAASDARKQLDQINTQIQDEDQRFQATQKLGQDFAMRLTQAGASPQQIAAATESLVPSANNVLTQKNQAEMQKAAHQSAWDIELLRAQKAKELEAMKLDRMGLKDPKKEAQVYTGLAEKFRKENKDSISALDKLPALKSILDKTPDRIGVEMAKTGLLKFAGEDRVSDADVIRAQYKPSLREGIARRLELEMTGEALKDDRKFYQMILSHAEKKIKDQLRTKVQGYSTGTAELAGVDGEKLGSGLTKQLNLGEQAPPPKTLVQKLYSPKAKKTKLIYSDGTEEVVDGQR